MQQQKQQQQKQQQHLCLNEKLIFIQFNLISIDFVFWYFFQLILHMRVSWNVPSNQTWLRSTHASVHLNTYHWKPFVSHMFVHFFIYGFLRYFTGILQHFTGILPVFYGILRHVTSFTPCCRRIIVSSWLKILAQDCFELMRQG